MADLFMSFHVGFIATSNTRKLLVMNGRLVARHYLLSVRPLMGPLARLDWWAGVPWFGVGAAG